MLFLKPMLTLCNKHQHRSAVIVAATMLLVVLNYAKIDEASVVYPNVIIWRGQASWYSLESPGINTRTANNEYFDDRDLTCAIWGVPFDQKIKVTNLDNGRSIIVRVNDRGPHRRFVRRGRIIDLTKAAFHRLSSLENGLIRVSLEFL